MVSLAGLLIGAMIACGGAMLTWASAYEDHCRGERMGKLFFGMCLYSAGMGFLIMVALHPING